MSENREIELKLTGSSSELRRLQRHPLVQRLSQRRAVTRTLETVYFDTPDDDLVGAGFALRVRREGARRVQTVKGERAAAGGLFDRLEVEAPIDGDVPDLDCIPDPALAARLREIVGGKRLVPVFGTSFRRTRRLLRRDDTEWTLDVDEGAILVEDATAPIHEAELELRSGDPAQLFAFALALQQHFDVLPATRSKAERGYDLARRRPIAPRSSRRVALQRDDSVETALGAVLSQCLGQFTSNAECASEGLDPEGVHQMRVGVRRARAALVAFRPVLPVESTRWLRAELRWLGRELGGARDLDVFTREILPPIEADLGSDPAFKRLREEALALRADCYAAVREALVSPRYARLVLELGAWVAGCRWREQPLSEASARLFAPAHEFASELLERRHRKIRRLGQRLAESDEARHGLRIQLKRLRYTGEFFRGLYPRRRSGRYLRRVGRLQSALGHLNDVVSAHGILENLLARLGEEHAPAHDRAAGFIEGWTSRVARGEQEDLGRLWHRLGEARPFWRD